MGQEEWQEYCCLVHSHVLGVSEGFTTLDRGGFCPLSWIPEIQTERLFSGRLACSMKAVAQVFGPKEYG